MHEPMPRSTEPHDPQIRPLLGRIGGQGKFFSNGFDLAWAESAGSDVGFKDRLDFRVEYLKPLIADVLSLPVPTIAAVTGHVAAVGFLLAISHDYVLMRKDRGVLYMRELDIGLALSEYVAVAFGEKTPSPTARRNPTLISWVLLLEAETLARSQSSTLTPGTSMGAKKLRAEEAGYGDCGFGAR